MKTSTSTAGISEENKLYFEILGSRRSKFLRNLSPPSSGLKWVKMGVWGIYTARGQTMEMGEKEES